MILEWFNGRAAAEIGTALADQIAFQAGSRSAASDRKAAHVVPGKALRELLQRTDPEGHALRLNTFKRAIFANSFKWKLLEHGVEQRIADDTTEALVLHLSLSRASLASDRHIAAAPPARPDPSKAQYLFSQGNKCFAREDYSEALGFYQDLVKLNPRHAEALNNIGATLSKLCLYKEAEDHFRQAIEIKPDFPEAHGNLGNALRWKGQIAEAELSLRRALKLKPKCVDTRCNLALILVLLGRFREAKSHFAKVLKFAPRQADALLGLGQIAGMEGRFDEAETMIERALAVKPKTPTALAALTGIRRMTSSDGSWLATAKEVASSGIAPLEETNLRFAIGKFHDDVRDFALAFESYKRANELQKAFVEPYNREARSRFVDDLIRTYPRDTLSSVEVGTSASTKPVFVVGMMRSGTSLIEQIIASHQAVKGAGELGFWSDALQGETAIEREPLGGPARMKLAEAYLRVLAGHSIDALRIVDKAPINSDYLGVIHSIFPNARIIYMKRDPIDTCLSCYFQQFSPSLNFTMDLSDLAHYYRQHQRLIRHWRAALPPGTILDVPYENLVTDQEGWTRKILDFLGLDWDERCLHFHKTKRPVVTASCWQVRQEIYGNSVARWRNYEKFIGPLLRLKDDCG